MSGMPLIRHEHVPLYRVARAGWADPLDTSFSQRKSNRWNVEGGHRVLYTCCSVAVAQCIVRDIFAFGALAMEDLRLEYRPVLAELRWRGLVVDLTSPEGLEAAGFPISYPEGIEHRHTQPFSEAWFILGAEGIVCRSASVFRLQHEGWRGRHETWSELAIFVDNAIEKPRLIKTYTEPGWLGDSVVHAQQ